MYLTRETGAWGSTNDMANWHAFAGEDPNSGHKAPHQRFAAITDGLSSTVLLGEGYSWCDGKGRLALNAWGSHSFGLTWGLNSAVLDLGHGEQRVNFPNGMPNTSMFRVRPKTLALQDRPVGADCCNNWASQTGHTAMNVTLADGSVRVLGAGVPARTWERLLKPRDGQAVGADW